MKIAVFGASGGTGLQVLYQNASQNYGHQLSVLVRDTERFQTSYKQISGGKAFDGRIVQGDVLDLGTVREVVGKSETVVVTVGTGGLGSSKKDNKICSEAQKFINQAVKNCESVRRVVVVSSIGVGDSKQYTRGFTWFFTNYVIYSQLADKEIQEQLLKGDLSQGNIDYTIVRPGGLSQQALQAQPKYTYKETDVPGGRISRANVAHFILTKCLAGNSETSRKSYSLVE